MHLRWSAFRRTAKDLIQRGKCAINARPVITKKCVCRKDSAASLKWCSKANHFRAEVAKSVPKRST